MNAMTKVAVSDKSRPLCGALSEPGAGHEQMLREVGPEELAAVEGGWTWYYGPYGSIASNIGGTTYYYYDARGSGWGWYSTPPWLRG